MIHVYTSISAQEARGIVGPELSDGAYQNLRDSEGSRVQRRDKLAFIPKSYICVGERISSADDIAGKLAGRGVLVAAEMGRKCIRFYNPRHPQRADLFTQRPKPGFRAAKQ